MTTRVGLNWAAFADELVRALVSEVRQAIKTHPGEEFYAAALFEVYRETEGVISLPQLSLQSAQGLSGLSTSEREAIWWSPPDWDRYLDDWLPGAADWERELTAEACAGDRAHWREAFHRYQEMLVEVCLRAREILRPDGGPASRMLVLVIDDEHYERLIRACVTEAEEAEHFPGFAADAAERERVAALPEPEQAAYYVAALEAHDGRFNREEVHERLLGLGSAAVPELLEVLRHKGRAWQAAKLLADLGDASPRVAGALAIGLVRLKGSDLAWTARALSRLGHLDLVFDAGVDGETLVEAVTAPFTSFRDHGRAPSGLDYRPLELFLDRQPGHTLAVERALKPGTSYCGLRVSEVDEAIRGLSSPHRVIRQHAVCVLGDRGLGPEVGERVIPLLARASDADPEPEVRRLAGLALGWWRPGP
jgi:hypothetical protein